MMSGHCRTGRAERALVADLATVEQSAEFVSAETLARWITRVNFSLMAEPADSADGGEEGILRHLLAPSLAPRPTLP
jgi:hypothetical protein